VQEHEGAWGIIQVSDVSVPVPLERLRTLFSAHAAERLGYLPLLQAWHIELGPVGRLSAEDRFDGPAIEVALNGLGELSASG
ncbi:MAG: hypothetical protein P4L84_00580, partial [Isosphaeraceae bacterium]|nr:hypothetical protein [Isosphaeraceae bacterium]